mgnify:FL=1
MTKADINVENILNIINCAGTFFKYGVDKKTEASKHHDDVLKEMNCDDNRTKLENTKFIAGALTGVATTIAGIYAGKKLS